MDGSLKLGYVRDTRVTRVGLGERYFLDWERIEFEERISYSWIWIVIKI